MATARAPFQRHARRLWPATWHPTTWMARNGKPLHAKLPPPSPPCWGTRGGPATLPGPRDAPPT
eukprot:64642-Lingulodinium_polyedra.AAC.1